MSNYRAALLALNRSALLVRNEIYLEDVLSKFAFLDGKLSWIEIRGISSFTQDFPIQRCASIMESVLTGVARAMPAGAFIVYQVEGDERRVRLRIGCPPPVRGVLASNLRAIYPGIDLPDEQSQALTPGNLPELAYGGVLTGYPGFVPADANAQGELPIDQLLRGMGKRPFRVTVVARLEPTENTTLYWLNWLAEQRQSTAGDMDRQFSDPSGMSQRIVDYNAQEYMDALEKLSDLCDHASRSAMWTVETFYAAADMYTADHLGGLLCAALNGDVGASPEAVACHKLRYHAGGQMQAQYRGVYMGAIAGRAFLNAQDNNFSVNTNPLANLVSSRELAGMMLLPRREYAGYFVDQYVEFDVDNRPGRRDDGNYRLGEIVRGCQRGAPSEGDYALALDDLTRHALIIGLTGGGKTNTSKGLLRSLWMDHHVPFLVIESAKREYWELSMLVDDDGKQLFPQLNVFTVGDENPETASPFRLNPMEAMPGVSLQTHIDYLLSAFKAAFELYPPMPYVLETAVYKVYRDRGWDIVTGKNRFGLARYPMLEELEEAIVEVTDNLHYDGEVSSNVKAALTARIRSLMVGSKDFMMNTARSVDMGYLLSRPTVLELEDLGDDDTKAFVIGILLVRIYEYRKSMQYATRNRVGGGKSLSHVIMVEEAHRLLKNVQGGGEGNQSRANAVEFFCNMLAEIRSFGQGFFIADQVPTKLAPDALKNTNLKIVHRTVMAEDREAVGRGMNMTPEQIEYLSALRVGYAAVFGEGDNRPKLVRFPLVVNGESIDRRSFIQACARKVRSECGDVYVKGQGTAACRWCPNCCALSEQADRAIAGFGGMGGALEKLDAFNDGDMARSLASFFEMFLPGQPRELSLCVAGKLLGRMKLTPEKQREIMRNLVEQTANTEQEV